MSRDGVTKQESDQLSASAPRRWRLIRWALVICPLALLAAYLSLPIWFPKQKLGQTVAETLSQTFQCPVQVGRVHVSWGDGVVIEDILIGADVPGPQVPSISIRHVSCPFTPLYTLASGQVRQLQIDDAVVRLRFDEHGRWLDGWPVAEFLNQEVIAPRIRLNRLRCELLGPEQKQYVQLDQMHFDIDSEADVIKVVAEAKKPASREAHNQSNDPDSSQRIRADRFTLDATVTLPPPDAPEQVHGQLSAVCDNLVLSDLPWILAERTPVAALAGMMTGDVKLQLTPALQVEYAVALMLEDVSVLADDATAANRVPNTQLHSRGAWDPVTDIVTLQQFEWSSEGLKIRSQESQQHPVAVLDVKRGNPESVSAGIEIPSWSAFFDEFPALATLAENAGLAVTGHASGAIEYSGQQCAIMLDAAESAIDMTRENQRVFEAPAGLAKRIVIDAACDPRHQSAQHVQANIHLGSSSVRATIYDVPLTPSLFARTDHWHLADKLTSGEFSFESAAIEETLAMFPEVVSMSDQLRCAGPVRFSASLQDDDQGGRRIQCSLHCSEASRIEAGPWLTKLDDEPLALTFQMPLPNARTDRLTDLQGWLQYGSGRIELDATKSTLEYDLQLDTQSPASGASVAAHSPTAYDGEAASSARGHALNLAATLPVTIEEIDQLARLFPAWSSAVEKDACPAITGRLNAGFDLNADLSRARQLLTAHVNFNMDKADLRWNHRLTKPAGAMMRMDIFGQFDSTQSRTEYACSMAIEHSDMNAAVEAVYAPASADHGQFEWLHADLDVLDVAGAGELCPMLNDTMSDLETEGQLAARISSLLVDRKHTVSIELESDHLQVTNPKLRSQQRSAPIDTHFEARWSKRISDPQSQFETWQLEEASGACGGVSADSMQGEFVFDSSHQPPGLAGVIGLSKALVAGTTSLKTGSLQATGGFSPGCQDSPDWLCQKIMNHWPGLDVKGPVRWEVAHLSYDDTLHLQGQIDARQASIALHQHDTRSAIFEKPANVDSAVSFNLEAPVSDLQNDLRIRFEQIQLNLAGNRISATGVLKLTREAEAVGLRIPELTVNVDCPDLPALAAMHRVHDLDLRRGGIEGTLKVAYDEDLRLQPSSFAITLVETEFGDHLLSFDGRVHAEQDKINLDQIRWAWGASQGMLSGALRRSDDGQLEAGRLGLTVEHLDIESLIESIQLLQKAAADAFPLRPAWDTDRLLEEFSDADLLIDIHADSLNVPLPLGIDVLADVARQRATLQDGLFELTFSAVAEGGTVQGSLDCDLNADVPMLELEYDALKLQPGALVESYLMRTFPGMVATGPLTLIDESRFPLQPEGDEPQYETGEGELIIEGGTVQGRAAPAWVTRIFPSLNLANFKFTYMHSWFRKFKDGRIEHQMIFQGKYYNLYMAGENRRDGSIDYEVGLDFLADYDSKYWAESGQGRVPLFVKTGQIGQDGSLVAEQVRYVPSRFLKSLVVSNNLFITGYHAVKKRLSTSEPTPDEPETAHAAE